MENTINQKNVLYKNIDALRSLSCLGIIIMHICANTEYKINDVFFNQIIPEFTQLVYLFLTISGFGMCCGYYNKIRTNSISLYDFYHKRYMKILPFFAFLIFVDLLFERSLTALMEGIIELTLVFGLLPNNELEVIGVGWTLGVIFLFYITFPFFVFLLWSKRRSIIVFGLALLINYLCTYYFFGEKFVIEGFSNRHSFLFCAVYFILGGLIYLFRSEIGDIVTNNRKISFLLCCVVVISYFYIPNVIGKINLFTIKTLIVCFCIISYAISAKSKVLDNKLFHYISSISMEMYLAHMVIFRIVEKIGFLYLFGTGYVSLLFVFGVICIGLIIFIEGYRYVIKKTKDWLILHKFC